MATQYDSLVGRYLGISSSAFFHRLLLCSLLQFSPPPSLPFSFCITNRDPSSTSTLVLVFVPGRPPRGEERGGGGPTLLSQVAKEKKREKTSWGGARRKAFARVALLPSPLPSFLPTQDSPHTTDPYTLRTAFVGIFLCQESRASEGENHS